MKPISTLVLGMLAFSTSFTPALAAPDFLTKNLRVGSRGQEVELLQSFLAERNLFFGTVSGFFGRQTAAAVRKFQNELNIRPITGTVGPKTRAEINKILGAVSKNSDSVSSPTLPALNSPPANSVSSSTVTLITPNPARPIDGRTIVALRCFAFLPGARTSTFAWKGSGVLVSSDGYVLTARHMVDLPWTAETTGDSNLAAQVVAGYRLDRCDAALPDRADLPSVADIRQINPERAVRIFAYTTQVAALPDDTELSSIEKKYFDVALLKITATTTDAQYFNLPQYLPNNFPYSRIGAADLRSGAQLISFGYPGEPGLSSGSQFNEFFLKGSIEKADNVYSGDRKFQNVPMLIEATAENATLGGRSGSPVFMDGKIIGIISATDRDLQRKTYAVHIEAIRDILNKFNIRP